MCPSRVLLQLVCICFLWGPWSGSLGSRVPTMCFHFIPLPSSASASTSASARLPGGRLQPGLRWLRCL